MSAVTSFRAQRGERFPLQNFPARKHADGGDDNRGDQHSRDAQADQRAEWNIQRVAADRPRQANRAGGADAASEQAEQPVLEEQHGGNQATGRAQRLEDRRFIDAPELRHRHRADQNQQTAQQHQRANYGHRERDVVDHGLDRVEDFAAVDDRYVGRGSDERALQARPRHGIVRPLHKSDEAVRRLLEHARTEHEHESAGAAVGPFDKPYARHPGADHAAQDVEANRVADVDLERLVDELLDRHFRLIGRRRLPNLPGHHFLVALELGAVGDGVFAPQRAAAADVLVVLEIDLAPLDADDTGAQHRQQTRLGGARLLVSRDRGAHPLDLVLLDVEQEHVGRFRIDVDRELGDQVFLQRPNADDEEAAEADREQYDPHLAAGAPQLQHGVPQRERLRFRQWRNRPNQQRAGEVQDNRRGRKAAGHHQTDAQRAGLPDGQANQAGHHEYGDHNLHEVDAARPRLAAQEQRRFHMPHVEQRHQREQQRHQDADAEALQDGRHGQRVRDVDAGRDAGEQRRNRAHRQRRQRHAERAAGEPENRDLCDIDRQQLRRAPANALEDGDALHLLLHEHARHARHADAAENHDHQADEAQIVFGAGEILADVVFRRLVGAHACEFVDEIGAQVDD